MYWRGTETYLNKKNHQFFLYMFYFKKFLRAMNIMFLLVTYKLNRSQNAKVSLNSLKYLFFLIKKKKACMLMMMMITLD